MAQDLFGMLDEAAADSAQNVAPPAIAPTEQAPTPTTPTETQAVPSPEFNVLDAVKDLGSGIVAGAEKAVIGTRKTIRAAGRAILPEALQDDAIKEENDAKIQPHAEQPTTLLGKIASDVAQFGLGFVGGSALLKGVGVAQKLPNVVREIAASGVGTGIVADPHTERLSNLIQEYPFLENPITEYLSAKESDSIAEGKLKASLEDMLTTPVAMLLIKGVKAIKKGVMPGKSAADDILKDVEAVTEAGAKPVEKFKENIIEVPEVKVTADAPVTPPVAPLKSNITLGDEWLSRQVSLPSNKSFVVEDTPGFNKYVQEQTTEVVKEADGVKYVLDKSKSNFNVAAFTPMEDGKGWMRVGRLTFGKKGGKTYPENIAVTPEFQRKGIATNMVDIAKGARDDIDFTNSADGRVSADGAAFLNKINGATGQPVKSAPQPIINLTGAGQAISSNMYQAMWEKVQKGVVEEGGKPSSTLQAAKILFDSGKIKTVEDFKHAAQGIDSIKSQGLKGPEFQQAMKDFVSTFKAPDNTASTVVENPVASTAGAVGPSPQAMLDAQMAAKKEALVKSTKGDGLFQLTPKEKNAWSEELAHQVGRGNLDNLFQPVNGAFNYSKMDSPTEVKTTLEFMAETLKPMLDKNVGEVQTFREIKSLAGLVGAKPEQMIANLKTWGIQDKMMAPTVVAAKNWMQSLSSDIYKLSRSIHLEGTGGDSAKVEMLRLIDILADVEGMTKSLQKAAARTTAAGRIRTTAKYSGADMKKMIDAYGGPEALDKLAERLALSEGDASAIIKTVQASGFKKFIDTHNELWINGILSGVKTHVINVTSTTANTLAQPLNMIVGGTIRREWDDVREGVAIYRGLRTMLGDSFDMARRAFATEKPIIGGAPQVEHAPTITAQNYKLDPDSWIGSGVDVLGKVIRFPGRFLTAEDEFFKQMNYRAKLMAQASREASELVRNGKLAAKDAETYVRDRFKDGFSMQAVPGDPKGKLTQTFGTDENALRYAEEATMTQDLKTSTWFGNRSFGETMQTVANTHPILRGTILPFVRVPVNLARQAVDYGPAAVLYKRYWADLAAGGTRRSVAMGKLTLGTNAWLFAGLLASEGMITGRAPGDKELREAWLATGKQPYSFAFGPEGNKTYVSFQRFDPIGMVFGLAADFAQMTNHVSENERNSMALQMTLALAENFSSKSYLKGVIEISSMLGSGYAKEEIAQRLINMRASSYVPNWVSLGRSDDEMKNVRTAMDAVMAKIPFLSEQIEARRDYLGQKKLYPMEYPWSAVNPFTVSEDKPDPVMKELARLATSNVEAQFTQPREKLGTLDLSTYKLPSGQTAYDRWLEKIGTVKKDGKTFHDALQALFDSPRYKAANDGTSVYHTGKRVVMIHREQERYRQEALESMLKEFQAEHRAGRLPFDLYAMAHQDQTNVKRVQRNKTPLEILRDSAQ